MNSESDMNTPELYQDILDISPYSNGTEATVTDFLKSQADDVERTQISRGKTVALYSVCETLQVLLGSFADPVIPFEAQDRCISEGYLTFSAAKQVIRHLPQSHYNVFVYVMSFLAFLCKNYRGTGEVNSATLGNSVLTSAKLFAPILLRSPNKPPAPVVSEKSTASVPSYLNPFGYYLSSTKVAQSSSQPELILDAETRSRRKAMFLQHFLDNTL